MKIVLAGYIAIEATHKLVMEEKPALCCRFSNRFLSLTDEMTGIVSLTRGSIDDALSKAGFKIDESDIREISDTGIFGSLWEFAEDTGCGLNINLDKISIKQETIEIFEYMDINPYTHPSRGSFLIRTNQPYDIEEALNRAGIVASVIGTETKEKDRLIINQDEKRFLTPIDRLLKDEQGKGMR